MFDGIATRYAASRCGGSPPRRACTPGPLLGLQQRVCGVLPELPPTAVLLFKQIRAVLLQASDDGLLQSPKQHIFGILKRQDTYAPERKQQEVIIAGGPIEQRNFNRDPALPHFLRDDGAWFDFTLTLRERRGEPLQLLAYSFEIRFAAVAGAERPSPPWLRFDLNFEDHPNEIGGFRSHCHPGHDDIQVPAPLLHPLEAVDLFLRGLRLPPKQRQ